MLTSSVTVSAETVDGDDLQEISVTLSVDEFADLASDYGYSVSIGGGSGDIAEPQMHKDVTYTFTDSTMSHQVGQDHPLLYEEVQFQNVTFSDNIESIEISLLIHLSETEKSTVGYDGYSCIFKVAPGVIYKVYMKANAKGSALSNSNTGWVSFYWTDRGNELIR